LELKFGSVLRYFKKIERYLNVTKKYETIYIFALIICKFLLNNKLTYRLGKIRQICGKNKENINSGVHICLL
jgi:hypothetical protein